MSSVKQVIDDLPQLCNMDDGVLSPGSTPIPTFINWSSSASSAAPGSCCVPSSKFPSTAISSTPMLVPTGFWSFAKGRVDQGTAQPVPASWQRAHSPGLRQRQGVDMLVSRLDLRSGGNLRNVRMRTSSFPTASTKPHGAARQWRRSKPTKVSFSVPGIRQRQLCWTISGGRMVSRHHAGPLRRRPGTRWRSEQVDRQSQLEGHRRTVRQ